MKKNIFLQLVKPAIRELQAYQIHEAQGLIKLDAMENPYQWPAQLKERWLQHLQNLSLNRYPDGQARKLKKLVRECFNIPEELSIMFGNGSDELIQIVAMSISGAGKIIMSPEPGFAMYRLISRMLDSQYVSLPLTTDIFDLDISPILKSISEYQPALVFIAYPNNPTGNLFDRESIIKIIEATNGFIVIDEAYQAFSNASFLDLIQQYENLLVLRTLSKSGLAGLRLGYLAGHGEVINELEKVRLPYNINVLSQATAQFILENHEILQEQADNICQDRQKLFEELTSIPGIKVWPSSANFLLFRCVKNANEIYQGLKELGILIKNLHGQHPQLENCLRVTVGTPDENNQFIGALQKLLT